MGPSCHSANAHSHDRCRVLVIDADPLFRSTLVSILRREFLVSVAGDGADGYHKALEHPPDIVVTEIALAGWDGLRTIKAFRSDATLAQVDIVVLTADASRDTVLAAIRAGASEYVIKAGFSGEEFVQRLKRLQRRPTASPPPVDGASPASPRDCGSAMRPHSASIGARNLQTVIDSWE